MPIIVKVTHINSYRYTNDSHIPLPLQIKLTYTFHIKGVKKKVLSLDI